MNILVTGGAGFIGSHVIDVLLASGHTVSAIDDLSTGKRENLPDNIAFHAISITDPAVEDVFAETQPDSLVHLAAQVSVNTSVQDPVKDMEINIMGTVRLLEAAVRHKVKKVVFSSTGGAIYGEQDYYPADEQHPLRPLSPYGIGKLAAEKYLHFYHQTHGLAFTALRYSNVYGPRQDPFGEGGVVAIFTNKFLAGQQPVINGDGLQTRDFVFVKDVARANLAALRNDYAGEINIGTGRETNVNELFAILRDITGSQMQDRHGPALAGEVPRSVLSWDKASSVLGWQPSVSLEKGLEETVRYFRQKQG